MKKTSFLVILAILVHLGNQARTQALPLSDKATASVITCGAGNDFYLTFGHSAIRIYDPGRIINGAVVPLDSVYNYGTFDFDTPHFYLKFFRGRLDYCLSRTPYQHFILTYDFERRAVWEQPLNFTPQQVNNLYLALEWNYRPENRYYRYDFFRDNCATRVRDMVEAAVGHDSLCHNSALAGSSYRRMLHQSTAGGCLEWWTMGVDLLLGLPADHRCDPREAMFHPLTMMETYAQSTLQRPDGTSRPVVAKAQQHLADLRPPLHHSFPPMVVFGLIFTLAAVASWRGWWKKWMDSVLFILAGIVGLFLVFMWFGTDHYCTSWNLHILWASPLLILIAIRLGRSPRWALWFQEACFLAAALWVVVCGLSPAYLPLILTLALRVACLIPRKPQQPRQLR